MSELVSIFFFLSMAHAVMITTPMMLRWTGWTVFDAKHLAWVFCLDIVLLFSFSEGSLFFFFYLYLIEWIY